MTAVLALRACGADEVIMGGAFSGRPDRGVTKDEKNTLVFGAVEVCVIPTSGSALGESWRLRLAVTPTAPKPCDSPFSHDECGTGSEIYTDGWKALLHQNRVDRLTVNAFAANRHSCAAYFTGFRNLKTWPQTATAPGLTRRYLQNYLDDFLRFNRRNPDGRFQTCIGLGAHKVPVGYEK